MMLGMQPTLLIPPLLLLITNMAPLLSNPTPILSTLPTHIVLIIH
jgi:hypothetical protein